MTLPLVLSVNLGAVLLMLVLVWLASVVRRDVSIVDIFWGVGFVLVAWVSVALCGAWTPRAIVLALMVSLWGLRLAGYLAWRNLGKPEDYRYAVMREHHGKRFPLVSLFTVFGLQGLLLWIISLPIQTGIAGADTWRITAPIGVALWALGLFFESVGDYQLARFKADPANRGRVMNRGLWRYTRHPNYFGDFLVWWGLYLAAFEPATWWTIVGPLLMSTLLIRVSGVQLLESSLRKRKAGYDQYVQDTSAFLPLPPRRRATPD